MGSVAFETIHVPQPIRAVCTRTATIFLEVVLVPALILAALGGAGQVTLGIVGVLVWRIVVAAVRLGLVGMLPATTILTFGILSAKTGAGTVFGMTDAGSALVAYVIPGCAVSLLAGLYFVRSSFMDKPILMKLAQDFVDLTPEARDRLRPVFQRLTLLIGVLQSVFATAGGLVVLTTHEAQAAVITGILTVATPLSFVVVCAAVGVLMMRRLRVRVCFKQKVQTA